MVKSLRQDRQTDRYKAIGKETKSIAKVGMSEVICWDSVAYLLLTYGPLMK